MSLSCEICESLTDLITPDETHAVCSKKCFYTLQQQVKLDELLENMKVGIATAPKTTLQVQGKGQVKVTPDKVRITIVIIRQGKTTAEVNKVLIENSDALITLLQDVRVEKLETKDLSLDPIREKTPEEKDANARGVYYSGPQGKIIGYEGKFPISFETNVANAGPLIDMALKDGYADVLENVQYVVSDPVSKSAYNDALRLATLDAQMKSEIVFTTLGLTKKSVEQIVIEETHYATSMEDETNAESFRAKSAMAMAPKMTKLIAGETEIEANITLTIAYHQ